MDHHDAPRLFRSRRTFRRKSKAPPPARIDTLRDPSGGGRKVRIGCVLGGGENRSGTFLEKRRERRDSPLIRLPPPSPRKRGEGICRDGFHPSHAQWGKSPLPACGERVRVRGGTVIGRRGRCSRSPPQFTSSSRCRRASLAYRRSGGFGGGLVFRGLAHVLVASGPFAIGSPSVCNLQTAAYIGHNEAAAQAASPPQKGL